MSDTCMTGYIHGREPIASDWHYCDRHPLEYVVSWHGEGHAWMISRELIMDAFLHPGVMVGAGDVRVLAHATWFTITLLGTPVTYLARDIYRVLTSSLEEVPRGAEIDPSAVDDLIESILG